MTTDDPSKHVHVVVHLSVRPEAESRAIEIFNRTAEATRREAACIRYDLFRSLDDGLRFVLVEEWRDQAGLDAHMQEPHVKTLGAALPEILAAPLKLNFLTARVG